MSIRGEVSERERERDDLWRGSIGEGIIRDNAAQGNNNI